MVNPRIVGADLALRHGAIVDAQGNIIFVYLSPDGMNSSVESLYARSFEAAKSLPENCIVVCDWDRTISSWGGKKRTNASVGTLLTLVTYGFAIMARLLKQSQVQFVSPSAIREALGLPPQTSKEDVHKFTKNIWPVTLQNPKFHPHKDIRGDCIDAWLLASTYYHTRDK